MIYSVNYLCSGLSTYVCTLIYQTITFHIFSSTVSKQITYNHFGLSFEAIEPFLSPKTKVQFWSWQWSKRFCLLQKNHCAVTRWWSATIHPCCRCWLLLTAGGSKVRLCIFEATVARGKGLWPWRGSTSTLAPALASPQPTLPSIWAQHHYPLPALLPAHQYHYQHHYQSHYQYHYEYHYHHYQQHYHHHNFHHPYQHLQ